VQALSAPFALAADALSFLGSAFFLSRIRPAELTPDHAGRQGALSAGARFIWTSPILRPSLACVSVINFFNFMFMALFVLYATRSLHVRPGLLGVVLGAGAVGGVLGSLLTRRIASRAGVGRAYLIGCVVYPVPVLLVPLAAGPRALVLGMLFTAEFVSGFGVMILDISIGTIFAAVVPDPLRARVSGAFQAVNYGTRPLGALAGGAAGTLIGVHPRSGSPPPAGPLASCSCFPRRCPASALPSREDRARQLGSSPPVMVRSGAPVIRRWGTRTTQRRTRNTHQGSCDAQRAPRKCAAGHPSAVLRDAGAPGALPGGLLGHGFGAVQGLPDDVGVPGVLRGLGDHVQQHPAGGPTCPLLEPGRLWQRMRRVQVGERPDQVVGTLGHLVVFRQQPGQRLPLQHPEAIHIGAHV
jgi:hypothetical protein